jgi:hypothetical protein
MDGKKLAAKLEYLIFQELNPNFDDIVVDVDLNMNRGEPMEVDSYFISIQCNYKGDIDSVDSRAFSGGLNKVSDLVHSAASVYIITPDGKLKSISSDDNNIYIGEPRIDTIEYVADDTHKFGFGIMVIPRYETGNYKG